MKLWYSGVIINRYPILITENDEVIFYDNTNSEIASGIQDGIYNPINFFILGATNEKVISGILDEEYIPVGSSLNSRFDIISNPKYSISGTPIDKIIQDKNNKLNIINAGIGLRLDKARAGVSILKTSHDFLNKSDYKAAQTLQQSPYINFLDRQIFSGCDMNSITIGDGITNIGIEAFANCSNLEYMKIGKNTIQISRYADYFNTKLNRIDFNNKLKLIGEYAFYGSGLNELIFPDGLMQVGRSAFAQNNNLSHVRLPE
jgi:hypothetical protein